MQNHFDLTDEQFEQQLKSCELDPALFNHEAHLRLAWIYINKYGVDQAALNIEIQLKNYVAQLGVAEKYHQTITFSAVKAINHFMKKSKTKSFEKFLLAFPELQTNFKEIINSHYSFDIFTSATAKMVFVQPDVVPFD